MTYAAVMTGKGKGAISEIYLFGKGAGKIIGKVFVRAGEGAEFIEGRIAVGYVEGEGERIDQVTVGYSGADHFSINCHGNPLIVEMIMDLLAKSGARLISSDEMIVRLGQGKEDSLELETKLAICRVKSVEATRFILKRGLAGKVRWWQDQLENGMGIEQLRDDARGIVSDSKKANGFLFGLRAVIAGAANSGKSTLLNALAGRQKSIVTDIKGTTRDHVTAECMVGGFCVDFVDTAGIENGATVGGDRIEEQSQRRSLDLLVEADVVIVVIDGSENASQVDKSLVETISGKKILTVVNKCDLERVLRIEELPKGLTDIVEISAKKEENLDRLMKRLIEIMGGGWIGGVEAVCVTKRQERLVRGIAEAESVEDVKMMITELLNGDVFV